MTTLARQLRLADYFALAFGTMVGVGWLVLMDDWLGRGGPLGAILGFALGGILRLPVGSGGGRQACGVHLSIAEFVRTVPRRRTARIPSAAGAGRRAYDFSRRAELPRHSVEC